MLSGELKVHDIQIFASSEQDVADIVGKSRFERSLFYPKSNLNHQAISNIDRTDLIRDKAREAASGWRSMHRFQRLADT